MAEASLERWLSRLRRGQLPAAIALIGADAFLHDLFRERILSALIPDDARVWGVRRLSAREISVGEVVAAASMRPMLLPHQVVHVTDLEAWEKLSAEVLEELERYLARPAPFTLLLLEAERLDRRLRLARLLEQYGIVPELDAVMLDAATLASELAAQRGRKMDEKAAALLAEAVGGQPARIASEVEKLATYAGPGGTIDVRAVQALVVASRAATVWEMIACLYEGDLAAAMHLLDDLLRAGESAVAIVGALAWNFKKVIEARALLRRLPPERVVYQLGARAETAERLVRLARQLSDDELTRALEALARADDRLKASSGAQQTRLLLELLLLGLPRGAARMKLPRRAGVR